MIDNNPPPEIPAENERVSWLEAEWLLPNKPQLRAFVPLTFPDAEEHAIPRVTALDHIRHHGAVKVRASFGGVRCTIAIIMPSGAALYLETTAKKPEPA